MATRAVPPARHDNLSRRRRLRRTARSQPCRCSVYARCAVPLQPLAGREVGFRQRHVCTLQRRGARLQPELERQQLQQAIRRARAA
jgi:hypothetical protein